jgi:hypothetical protein
VEVLSAVLDVLVLAVVAVGVVLWKSAGAGAEEAAKAGVNEAMQRINWDAVLGRELERLRGTERQELRFKSYGELWAKMRPLAIYDDTPVNQSTMKDLSRDLSDWYFSVTGGLMLTAHNRDLYFALQDLVIDVASQGPWEAERAGDPKTTFAAVLQRRELAKAQALVEHFAAVEIEEWPRPELAGLARGWRDELNELATGWDELDPREQFAVLQQTSSAMRTALVNDVESRLR